MSAWHCWGQQQTVPEASGGQTDDARDAQLGAHPTQASHTRPALLPSARPHAQPRRQMLVTQQTLTRRRTATSKHSPRGWGCKMVQPLRKTMGQLLEGSNTESPRDPAVPGLGRCPETATRLPTHRVHSSILPRSHDVEATPVSVTGCPDQETGGHAEPLQQGCAVCSRALCQISRSPRDAHCTSRTARRAWSRHAPADGGARGWGRGVPWNGDTFHSWTMQNALSSAEPSQKWVRGEMCHVRSTTAEGHRTSSPSGVGGCSLAAPGAGVAGVSLRGDSLGTRMAGLMLEGLCVQLVWGLRGFQATRVAGHHRAS